MDYHLSSSPTNEEQFLEVFYITQRTSTATVDHFNEVSRSWCCGYINNGKAINRAAYGVSALRRRPCQRSCEFKHKPTFFQVKLHPA